MKFFPLLWSLLVLLPAARGTTVVPPEFTALVAESDYVVRAVVKSIGVEAKTKPGRRPVLFSLIELEVRQVIHGRPPSPLVLQVLGGKRGDQEMYIAGAPRFAPGDEAIFFVQGNGVQIFPLVRLMHGLYPVCREAATGREFVARSNGEPLHSPQEVSQPLPAERRNLARPVEGTGAALTPEEFVARIQQAAREIRARE